MSYLEDTLAAIHQVTTFEELADLVDSHVGEIPTGETWLEAANRLAAEDDSDNDLTRILRAATGRWAELKGSGSSVSPPSAESKKSAKAANGQNEIEQYSSTNPSAGSEEALRSQPAVDTRPPSRSKNYHRKS